MDWVSLQEEGGLDTLGRGKSIGKGRRGLQDGVTLKQGREATTLMVRKTLQAV